MNHFSISDIENLTGIKAHTIRIWEQRYRICQAKRKESGHRFYDDEDLRNLLRLSFLYKEGHKISNLAGMDENELLTLASCVRKKYRNEEFVNQLLDAAQAFDQVYFDKILSLVVLRLSFERCITEVIYPFLDKLGQLWLTDKVVPAQEHFACNLIRKKIIVAIDGLDLPDPGKASTVLLFTPVGEAHELPLLFMHYLLKKNGCQVIYMGTEVSPETLVMYCNSRRPGCLYFHLITNLGNQDITAYLRCLTEKMPGIPLVVSGPAFATHEGEFPASVRCLRSTEEMISFAANT